MFCEIKKFYTNLAVLIMLAFILLMAIILPIFFINGHETYSYKDGKILKNTGLAGYSIEKAQANKTKGKLDEKKLNEVLAFYKSFDNDMDAIKNTDRKYPGLSGYLLEAYAPYGAEAGFSIKSISNADDFYKQDLVKIKSKIALSGQKDFFNASIPEIERRILEIKKPYVVEFVAQWPVLMGALTFLYIAIAVFSVFISSIICSFEKEQKMDLILSAINKKRLMLMGHKKMFAMLFYITILFSVCTIIVSSIVFLSLGLSGWNTQIQNLPGFFTSLYNWSIGEMYIVFVVMAWVGVMSIAMIGFLVNASFQQTYTSLIITASLTLSPLFFYNSEGLPIWIQKVFLIQPINGAHIVRHLNSLFVYNTGFGDFLSSTVFFIEAIGCIIIIALFSPRLFARQLR